MDTCKEVFNVQSTNLQERTSSLEGKNIILVANTGWYLFNFRENLINYLSQIGAKVTLVSPRDKYSELLVSRGFKWIELRLDRRSVNPFLEIMPILQLATIYNEESPFIVHHFTVKCVIYGTIAAHFNKVNGIINSITGLGYVFLQGGWRRRLLRALITQIYKLALNSEKSKVIFQNEDNLNFFLDLEIVDRSRAHLIRSSGVDLQRFDLSRFQVAESTTKKILFFGRVIALKGIYDFVAASKILKKQGQKAIFQIAGTIYPDNPSAITIEQLNRWSQKGFIEWLGHQDDIESWIAQATLVVLPTHGGEGVPKTLIEAAAMEKPLIATDVPGCHDVVEHGVNGLLVPAHSPNQLAEAIAYLLERPELCREMGYNGRMKVFQDFNSEDVVHQTVHDIYLPMAR